MTATSDEPAVSVADKKAAPPWRAPRAEKAVALALRLAHAENALLMLTSGQVDSITDPSGKTYLLRPAQEELRQSERHLRAVIESTADVITIVDRSGVIVSQNAAAHRVLGYEPTELIGQNIFEFVHPSDLPGVFSAFFSVAEGFRLNVSAPFRHREPDGSHRLVEATMGRLMDGSSSTRVVISLRSSTSFFRPREFAPALPQTLVPAPEASERPRPSLRLDRTSIDTQILLSALNRLEENYFAPLSLFYRERLSYGQIAEVLNLEVGTVRSRMAEGESILRERLARFRATPAGAQLSLLGGVTADTAADFASSHREAGWQANEAETEPFDAPLDFTGEVEAQMQLRLEAIDAHDAARAALAHCQFEAATAEVEVLLYLRAEVSIVQADWARLLQVLCILVKHGIEVSSPGSTLSISTANDAPGRLTFELSDHGIGIEAALLPHVFDPIPLERLSEAQRQRGFPIGLNIVKRLTEAQAGALTVSSNGFGEGETFYLTLPTSPSRHRASVAPLV